MIRTTSRLTTVPLITAVIIGAGLPSDSTAADRFRRPVTAIQEAFLPISDRPDVKALVPLDIPIPVIGQDGSTTQQTLSGGIRLHGITNIGGQETMVVTNNHSSGPLGVFGIVLDGVPISASQSTKVKVYELPYDTAAAGVPMSFVPEVQVVGNRSVGMKGSFFDKSALWVEEYSRNGSGGIDSNQRVLDFAASLGDDSPCNFSPAPANLVDSTFAVGGKEYFTIECSDDSGAVTFLRGLDQSSQAITDYLELHRGGDFVIGPSSTGTSTLIKTLGWSVSGEFKATANLQVTAVFDTGTRRTPGHLTFDAISGLAGPTYQPDAAAVDKDGYARGANNSGDDSDGAQIRYNNSSFWNVSGLGTAIYPSIVRNRSDSAIEDPMLYGLSAQSTPMPTGLGSAAVSREFLLDDPDDLTGTGELVMTNNGYIAFRPPGPFDAAIVDSLVTDEYGFSGATVNEWRAAPAGANSNARSVVRLDQPLNEYTDIGLVSIVDRYAKGGVLAFTGQAYSYLPNGEQDQSLGNYLAIYEYPEGPYLFGVGDVNGDDLQDLGKVKWAEAGRSFYADLSYGSSGSFGNRVVYENDLVVDHAAVGVGEGADAAVALLGWNEAWQPRVQIRKAADGAFVNNVQFFDEGWNLIEMEVIHDFSGGPVIAVLAVNRTTGEIAAQLRRPTGAFVKNVFFLNANWNPLQLIVLPNLGGGAEPELGVLATNDAGQIAVMVKDAGTNGFIKNVFFLNANWTPLKAVPLPAEGTDGARVALLAANNSSGQLVVMVKEAATNTFLGNLFPFGSAWTPEDIVAVEDQGGNGYSEVAVLAINESSGKPVIQLRDSDTGTFVRNINPLGSNWRVTQMVNAGDADGDSGDDLAVMGVRKSDNLEVIQTLRASNGTLVSNAF